MERTKPLAKMSAKRDAAWGAVGRRPSSTLEKPGQPARAMRACRRPAGPDAAAVDAVIDRDGSCVVCGEIGGDERGFDWSIHHRKKRSQGGDDQLSNLVLVCGNGTLGCHSRIHSSPAVAQRAGWLVLRDEDPALIVMAHKQLGYVRLDDRGKWTAADPPDGA